LVSAVGGLDLSLSGKIGMRAVGWVSLFGVSFSRHLTYRCFQHVQHFL
jgi:hypothetical protein